MVKVVRERWTNKEKGEIVMAERVEWWLDEGGDE